jgi:HAD superfamily hydrolase (TIGR01459 family)
MSGFGKLAAKYDGFIVDLWGVVHDGVKPYPGVLELLATLRASGKRVVFLSNAPRRAAAVGHNLVRMGVTPDLYDGIMSSGEAVYQALATRTDLDFVPLGHRLYHLGPPRDRDVFELPGLIEVARPSDADFLLNTGPDDLLGPADPALYDDVLNEALAAGLKMLCANPDLEVVRDGERIICAGALAQVYAARGGAVIQRGKPDPAIYGPTLALLGMDASRVLAIGDSLRTDIAGAKAAGIDSCWVLSGIHALDASAAPAEAAQAGLFPVAILPGFRW